MVSVLFTYWWVIVPTAAVAAFYVLRIWAERRFESVAEDILRETQAGFAKGNVELHSIIVAGTTMVDDEIATLYDVDATITPSDQQVEWASADLFLYGIDEDGSDDQMRVGEVRRAQRWNGKSFESIKRRAIHEGTQRLKLSIRFAGDAGLTRFNYNFACFGPTFELPEAEAQVSAMS